MDINKLLITFGLFSFFCAPTAYSLSAGKYQCEPRKNGKVCLLKFKKNVSKSLKKIKHPPKYNLYYKPYGKVLKVKGRYVYVYYSLDEKYRLKTPSSFKSLQAQTYGDSFSHN